MYRLQLGRGNIFQCSMAQQDDYGWWQWIEDFKIASRLGLERSQHKEMINAQGDKILIITLIWSLHIVYRYWNVTLYPICNYYVSMKNTNNFLKEIIFLSWKKEKKLSILTDSPKLLQNSRLYPQVPSGPSTYVSIHFMKKHPCPTVCTTDLEKAPSFCL
jgi:hypothetical protein